MSIYKKLFEAKKEIGKITKDSTNPFFKSKYLSLNGLLDAVEPVLEKHGLLLLQPIKDGSVYTTITDIDPDGGNEVVQSFIQLPNIQDPQKLGSAITYYRRYTLQSLLSAQAGDDDSNESTTELKEQRKPAFKAGGWDYLMSDEATQEHIQHAIDTNRMTPQEKETLKSKIK